MEVLYESVVFLIINQLVISIFCIFSDQKMMSLMAEQHEKEFNLEFDNFTNPKLVPSKKDLQGSFDGLLRIHKVYNLNPYDIANGVINYSNDNLIKKSEAEMNADECLTMANLANKSRNYDEARLWCKEVYRKHEKDQSVTLNEIKKVCENIKNVKTEAPTFDSVYYNYATLCQGQDFTNAEKKSKLKCYYKKGDQSYFRLKQIKVEELYKNPPVFLFHDVISDREIEELKNISKNNFERSKVLHPNGSKESNHRVSKVSWVEHDYNNLTRRLIKRIEEVSGLSAESAESFQIQNYGLGGQYEPHKDYFDRGNAVLIGKGNRIATWLTYLNNVEAGGYTVFPRLGIGVRPQKGSALFWYNLDKSGEGIKITLHAACPVLLGTKWAANIWFRERGQEFIRPCGLKFLEK